MRLLPASALLLTLLGPTTAHAQQPPSGADVAIDVAAGRALLQEGKKLLLAGELFDAREKLTTSVEADPSPEGFLALGECHEKIGNTASAWGTYHHALERARMRGDASRAREAEKRAAAIEGKIPRAKIVVTASEPLPQVTLDFHRELGKELWGTPLPLDPGAHTVSVKSPGKQSLWISFDLPATNVTQEVIVPALVPVAPERPAPVVSPPTPLPPLPPPEPAPSPPKPGPSPAGFWLRVVGGVLLFVTYGTGVAFAVDTRSSTTLRSVGLGMFGGSLGVAATWVFFEVGPTSKVPARTAIGGTLAGVGALGVVTSFLIGCMAIPCGGTGGSLKLSQEMVITTLVGGLVVSPALIAGGLGIAASGSSKQVSLFSPSNLTISPLVAPNAFGLSLQGSF